ASIAFIAGLLAVMRQLWRYRKDACPASVWAPVAWIIAGVGGVALSRHTLGTPLAGAIAAVAALYGVVGLWISARAWRAMRGPFLLLMGALPVGVRADQWLGLPARLLTADLVRRILPSIGVTVDAADTVLIFESGLTNIAAACSGLRGLWTIAMVLVFVAMVEQRRVGLRLSVLVGMSQVVLIVGNAARVVVLVALDRGLQLRSLAELVHEPLGIAVFASVAVLSLVGLRHWVPLECEKTLGGNKCADENDGFDPAVHVKQGLESRVVAAAGACLLAAVACVNRPVELLSVADIELPISFEARPIEPIDAEAPLASSGRLQKWRFIHGEIHGQLILLQTSIWRAQHPPELCLQMAGHLITSAHDKRLHARHAARFIDIDDGRRRAVYWYQSRDGAGPSLWPKVWSAWWRPHSHWVMVSILLDEGVSSTTPVEPFLSAVYEAVQGVVFEGSG
ncbi:MAG: archaeosortase/exosortase family protein, partial [Myxococcota bacterium]